MTGRMGIWDAIVAKSRALEAETVAVSEHLLQAVQSIGSSPATTTDSTAPSAESKSPEGNNVNGAAKEARTTNAGSSKRTENATSDSGLMSGFHSLESTVSNAVSAVADAGKSVLNSTETVLSTIGHEALDVANGASMVDALFPGAALLKIGYDTWKDLSSGNTVSVDMKSTAADQIKHSGFELSEADGKGGGDKIDLNGVFQKAAASTSGGGSGAVEGVSAQQWNAILPVLEAPVDAKGRPVFKRTGYIVESNSLPEAHVGAEGIDFGFDQSDSAKSGHSHRHLKVANGVIQYIDNNVDVSTKHGHFTISGKDGYTFKDDGQGGRLVYDHGHLIYDLRADGSRIMNLPNGVKLEASADGKNFTVTDKDGKVQNLTLDQLRQKLSVQVGDTSVGLSGDTFTTAAHNRDREGYQVTRGLNYVGIRGRNFTTLIKPDGEALTYSSDEAVHRHADGTFWYQKGKDAPEQKIDPSKIESVTANKDLQDAVKQLHGLVEQGNGQIGNRVVRLLAGQVNTEVHDEKTGATASVNVDEDGSRLTEGSVSYVSKAGSNDTQIVVDHETLATLTTKPDDVIIATKQLVSSKNETRIADGAVVHEDGSEKLPYGVKVAKNGEITLPDGTKIDPDDVMHFTDGRSVNADQVTEQITAVASQAQAVMASVSGGGAATMDTIIQLECAIGQIDGLVGALNQLGDVGFASSLSSCKTALTGALGQAKENYAHRSGIGFINDQTTKFEQSVKRFAYLTSAA